MLKQVAQLYSNACVMIASVQSGKLFFRGSGFLCHENGFILTCAHLINLSEEIRVIIPRPVDTFPKRTIVETISLKVSVAQFDPLNDVALLKLCEGVTVTVPSNNLSRDNIPIVGASVGCLGFPFGDRGLHVLKVTNTIISGKSSSETGTKHLHLDSNIHPGNSGGPIVDVSSNKIIGLVSGRFSPTGSKPFFTIDGYSLGQDSTISFGTLIEYGIALMKLEGLHD